MINECITFGEPDLKTDDCIACWENTPEIFINYLMALALEVPIGNRAAEATFRQARLQRSASVVAYQQTIQDVALDVKNALRDVDGLRSQLRAAHAAVMALTHTVIESPS